MPPTKRAAPRCRLCRMRCLPRGADWKCPRCDLRFPEQMVRILLDREA